MKNQCLRTKKIARSSQTRRSGLAARFSLPSGSGWKRWQERQSPVSVSIKSETEGNHSFPESREVAKRKLVEAILFISREPLSARRLAQMADLEDPTEARTIARKLNSFYDEYAYSFRIEEVAGGMQMLTRPQFAEWLRKLEIAPPEELLSQGMLEALAIVAYRQPILRAEIEAIRGVNTDEVLRQLMQRDLVRIAGRHEDIGRPYLYGTTRRFLQLFGLQSLDSLPRAQKIREAEAEIANRLAEGVSKVQDMSPTESVGQSDSAASESN